jgi:phosphoenolpyruvate synthase/pyruvate phosphate dikinase
MLNVSMPQVAAQAATLPSAGVGLMRAEFLALSAGRHPRALLADGGADEYVALFRDGLRAVAEAFHPRPVTYRVSDLKSNEYRGLLGGEDHEAVEANPMIGSRGVHRYLERPDEFALELRAIREVRCAGYRNVRLMLPFVRTVAELREARALIRAAGLEEEGFEVWAMSEVPSTALLPEAFAAEVDGVSIGSNDLAQLVLGVDRDSPELGRRYQPTDPAVLEAIRRIIAGAHAVGRPASICGDRVASDPDLLAAVVEAGIDSVSVVPSAFESTMLALDSLCGAPA